MFPATRWTLVGRLRGDEAESTRALGELCRHYWFPIYATLRRTGRATRDAEDLTQSFFAALLADRTLIAADPERGRLRNFLFGALKRFLADEARHRLAQKRGGGAVMLSIEWARAEQRYLAEPVDDATPEKIHLSGWAHSFLERVREKVRTGFAGRETEYAALAPSIEGEENGIPFRPGSGANCGSSPFFPAPGATSSARGERVVEIGGAGTGGNACAQEKFGARSAAANSKTARRTAKTVFFITEKPEGAGR